MKRGVKGLTEEQVFDYVKGHEGRITPVIAEQFDCHTSTVTKIVTRLVKAGRVYRKRGEPNRRAVYIGNEIDAYSMSVTPGMVLEYIGDNPRCTVMDISLGLGVSDLLVRSRLRAAKGRVHYILVKHIKRFYLTAPPPLSAKHNPLITQLWVKGIELEAA